jgi:tetratricopeptide (TPR) repeat protein
MALWHGRNGPAMLQAIQLFEQAQREDPGYAEAYAGEALVYSVLPFFSDAVPREVSFRRSNMLALHALVLDPGMPEPYVALGNNVGNDIAFIDRATMVVLMRRAIALRPSFATAHQWLGNTLLASGDPAGGLVELERAAALDPRSLIIADNLAMALLAMGRNADALAVCKGKLAGYGCLEYSALATLFDGDVGASRAFLEALPDVVNPSARANIAALLAALEGRGDKHAVALMLAAQPLGSNVVPGSGNAFEDQVLSALLVQLGEPALAVDYRDRTSRAPGNSIDWAIRFPAMDAVRCQPRFQAMVVRLRTRDPRARCTTVEAARGTR